MRFPRVVERAGFERARRAQAGDSRRRYGRVCRQQSKHGVGHRESTFARGTVAAVGDRVAGDRPAVRQRRCDRRESSVVGLPGRL